MRKKIFPNILRARTRTIFPLWDPDPDFVSLFIPSIYSQLNQPSLLVCLPVSRGPCQMSNQPAHTKLVEHRLAPLPHLPRTSSGRTASQAPLQLTQHHTFILPHRGRFPVSQLIAACLPALAINVNHSEQPAPHPRPCSALRRNSE